MPARCEARWTGPACNIEPRPKSSSAIDEQVSDLDADANVTRGGIGHAHPAGPVRIAACEVEARCQTPPPSPPSRTSRPGVAIGAGRSPCRRDGGRAQDPVVTIPMTQSADAREGLTSNGSSNGRAVSSRHPQDSPTSCTMRSSSSIALSGMLITRRSQVQILPPPPSGPGQNRFLARAGSRPEAATGPLPRP